MRCELRPWRYEDTADVAKHADNEKIAQNLRDVFPHPYRPADAEAYVASCVEGSEERQICRAIVMDGHAVGSIGVFRGGDVYRKSGELGYWLAEEYWGRGLMTAAVKQVCREAFARWDIVRIYAEPFARNTASRRVLEKAGFTLEGVMRQGVYKAGRLCDYCMYALLRGEERVRLQTDRLLLRPFTEADAADLYEYAKAPGVGPIAGWPPHKSVEESREIIRAVFSAPNVFAVADRQSGKVIGSAGFVGSHYTELPGPDDEIGYALSPTYWGRGLIPEAVEELLRYGFEQLGLNTIWCSHYDGNRKSRRVIEKCGFVYRFSRETEVELMNERRLTHFYALTKEEWQDR